MAYRKLILLSICVLLMCTTVTAQDDQITNPDEPWTLSSRYSTIYIGENIHLNVTGPDNTSFTLKFFSHSDSNDTFRRVYKTDANGTWDKLFTSFRQEQQGNYSIQLIVEDVIRATKIIEVIYNEDQAQWIAIENIEDENDKQDRKDARQDEKIDNQNRLYKKWIMYFFIPGFCFLLFFVAILFIVLFPVVRLWWNADKKEISESRRAKWTWEFITGGTPTEDFSEEFPGTLIDRGGGKFEKDDPRITEDAYELTEEELEKKRREAAFGKNWEKEAPYGSIKKEDWIYPDPWTKSIWLRLILLTISISILILSIWFIWYVLLPSGIIILIIVLLLFRKSISLEVEIEKEMNIIVEEVKK